ncbi:MAG: four helix bundle protein [Phycisphaerales bacterium]
MGKTFRNLAAWQRGMELAREVYRETAVMPDSERFGLTSQMRRAAVSVPSNIAEGYGRGTRTEFGRFLRIARASLFELWTQLELATTMNMIEPHVSVYDLVAETDRVLQGLIRSLEQKESDNETP